MKCCPYCFDPIVQRPDEKNTNFNKRIYCGKKCSTLHAHSLKNRRKKGDAK